MLNGSNVFDLRQTTPFLLVVVFAWALGMSPSIAEAQLKTAGQRWPADQRVSIDQVDHSAWNQLLKKHVNRDGQVNYSAWKNSAPDHAALEKYLVSLSQADLRVPSSRAARLAYWINAYNAVTVDGILHVYPTSSIRKHTKKLGYNIWTDLNLIVGDTQINLEDIEHKVLRKMNEPRIHFAIVCASIGCPRLLNEAYVPNRIEEQLATNSRDFFSRSQNLQIAAGGQQLQLSAIMKWFGTDFGADQAAQVSKVAEYFPANVQQVVRRGGYRVQFLDYDWNLNEQK